MDFWEVLDEGRKIAEGGHSIIYKGIYNEKPVAIKILQLENQQQLQKEFDTEVNLLSRLHHSNVVEMVKSCCQTPFYCILTEFCSGGSLRSLLNGVHCTKLWVPMDNVVEMGLQIARGMEYVHSKGVIHRDLKPENVLIHRNCSQFKVADFGVSCYEKQNDFKKVGSLGWMAPEVVSGKKYGRKVDVYGFGLMLFEMVSGITPSCEQDNNNNNNNNNNNDDDKEVLLEIPESCPEFMRALIKSCCSKNPKMRPEFKRIVKVLEEYRRSGRCLCLGNNNRSLLFQLLKKKFCISK